MEWCDGGELAYKLKLAGGRCWYYNITILTHIFWLIL